jgi:integrase
MDRHALLKLIHRLAQVAGVQDAHPHKFRHTFAIEYLRNRGNERTLQDMLGHESLEMLRTYTRIAQVDMINGHQFASPVENWRL